MTLLISWRQPIKLNDSVSANNQSQLNMGFGLFITVKDYSVFYTSVTDSILLPINFNCTNSHLRVIKSFRIECKLRLAEKSFWKKFKPHHLF